MGSRQPVMARKEEIGQHAVEIEIDEPRALIQEKRFVNQHFLERNQPLFKLREQLLLLGAPLGEAPAAKFAFLVTEEPQPVARRHDLLPINVVELEAATLDLVFDVPPKNRLHPFQLDRKSTRLNSSHRTISYAVFCL